MSTKTVQKIYRLLLIIWLVVIGLLVYVYFSPRQRLRLVFLDVGQGDALLIQTPEEQNILIDGGPSREIIYHLDHYLPFYNRQFDLLILTHPQADHLNGLLEVVKRYPVKHVLLTGVQADLPAYLSWQRLIDQQGIAYHFVPQIELVDLGGARLDVLWPKDDLLGQSIGELNDSSIVNRLRFAEFSALLTSDISDEIEKQLIEREDNLRALLLKVAHHGSKYSSCPEFLRAVQPCWSVISVGENNSYGYPTGEVLSDLASLGAQVLRTDQLGDIVFQTDGEQFWLASEKRPAIIQ